MATLTDILTWWQRNTVPTVSQRTATFSSIQLKADGRVQLPAGTTSYNVPAGTVITNVWFWGGAEDVSIGVGTSEGDNDLFDEGLCPAHEDLPFEGNKYFLDATTIYFNGVASDTVVTIFKQ